MDSGVKTVRQKATAENTFSSLEKAVAAVHSRMSSRSSSEKETDTVPVSLVLRSNVYVEEALLLTVPIKISGINNPTITFGENAGFVVEQAALEINGCSIKRSERFTEPRTVPILYGSRGSIVLNGVSITVKEGGDVVILRDSRFLCTDSSFVSEQTAQAVLVRAEKSFVSALRSTFSATGLMALCFDFTHTQCALVQTNCVLASRYTGRTASLAASNLKVQDVRCSYRSPLFERMDAAFITDKTSVIELLDPLVCNGFSQPLIRN